MFKRLFNRNKHRQETQDESADTISYDGFELVFNTIKEVSIKYIDENESNFVGLTEKEVTDLENKFELSFPKAFRYFLRKFAGGQLKIFDYQSYDLKGIATAQEVSEELLLQDRKVLPENSFVFSQWQGYNFYYFVNSGSENPDTFLYVEGGGDSSSKPPTIHNYGSFTDWLVNLAINNVTIIGNLHGYKTEEGISKLKSLLTTTS